MLNLLFSYLISSQFDYQTEIWIYERQLHSVDATWPQAKIQSVVYSWFKSHEYGERFQQIKRKASENNRVVKFIKGQFEEK